MDSSSQWDAACDEIQRRILRENILEITEIKNAKIFRNQIQSTLLKANSCGVLKTSPEKIRAFLRQTPKNDGKIAILGGGGRHNHNFKRVKDLEEFPHFERTDGCWFDFSIIIDEVRKNKKINIIEFNFEIRFPEKIPVQFLRFDLSPPAHNNEDRGLRFHVHPGHGDIMIHSPPMTPMEILQLFLYGLPIPEKLRAQ